MSTADAQPYYLMFCITFVYNTRPKKEHHLREIAMFESSITVKGQTTLPKAIRESLAVKAGDKVRYVILDHGVLIMPVRPISQLYGRLQYDGPPATLETMDRAIAEEAAERWSHSTQT